MTSPAAPSPVTVTPVACERFRALLDARGKPSAGVSIGTKTRGCSGHMYTLEYADTVDPTSIRCDLPLGVTLFLQRGSLLYLIGMTIDYTEEDTQEGFVFRNPNEQGRCGCGESFHV